MTTTSAILEVAENLTEFLVQAQFSGWIIGRHERDWVVCDHDFDTGSHTIAFSWLTQ